jgi:hypothetical protein
MISQESTATDNQIQKTGTACCQMKREKFVGEVMEAIETLK